MNRPIRCGFVAILDPDKSIHTETVLRALHIYKDIFDNGMIEFILCEDYGSFEGGAQAATSLVSQGVDIVVGHYASNSALGAVSFYAEHAIPVLLPTATDTNLTKNRNNVFRLCANNDGIIRSLLSLFPRDQQTTFDILTDGSPYATKLAGVLNSVLLVDAPYLKQEIGAKSTVFIGTGTHSALFLQELEDNSADRDFILTDDAACAQLTIPDSLAAGQVRGIGFVPPILVGSHTACVNEYLKRYNEMPSVYFMETIAALEIISILQRNSDDFISDLNHRKFITSLGNVRFYNGERFQSPLCLWSNNENHQLYPVKII
ncbi:ABC transporter substrate-binding protein [Serratia rubidaea]|nr:ABC transporter substrate-binding protein [Serratia rubidaea]